MRENQTCKRSIHGKNFVFHILDNDEDITIGMSSDYVYPSADRTELRDLAEFILQYLGEDK